MKNFINILKIKSQAYFSTNILFVSFVIINLVNSFILRFLTVGNAFSLKPLIADTAILLIIGAFAYFIKPKKQYIYLLIWTIVLTAICVINSSYYTFYMSFASVSLLSTSVFIVDVGDAVVEQAINLKDFIYIASPIIFIFIHILLSRKNYYFMVSKIEKGKKMALMTLMSAFSLVAIFMMSLTAIEVSRLYKQWNREYIVTKFGLYTYQVNDVFQSIEPKISVMFGYDKAAKLFRDFYNSKSNINQTNKYTDIFKGKNVIVIHAESIQQIAMDMKFNGNEVTPNVNRLAREGIFFDNFYSQSSVGTSSDAEFTFNTGLLPVSSGTVFISYSDREFTTTPNLLKENGYYTSCMHANNPGFWNRNVMYKQIGYDRFFSKGDYEIDEVMGLGLSDKSFFKQSVTKIKDIKNSLKEGQSFYTTLITLTNHTPWDEKDMYGEFPVTMPYLVDGVTQNANYMENTTLGNYFQSTHYADAQIGMFIDELDKEGLLENTIVVIYGDHDARISKKDYILLNNYDPETNSLRDKDDPNYVEYDYYDYELDRSVPFIIWSKEKTLGVNVKTAMGMYDVLPTLGNMLGIESKYSLGVDIFNVSDNTVVFPNGNFLTNSVYYNNNKEEYKALDTAVISTDYIEKNAAYASKLLSVSDAIIKFDLVKKQRLYDILKEEN